MTHDSVDTYARLSQVKAAKAAATATTAAPPALRRSQALRREQAESRLLDAALQIVGQRGTHAMTLAEVGEKAGFSRSLPAFYFGSKQGLIQRLLEQIHQRHLAERDAGPRRRPGLEAILGSIDVYFIRRDPQLTSTRALFALMAEALSPASELHPDVADYVREARRAMSEQIAIGVSQREVRADVDPVQAAELILAGLRGTMLQWLTTPALIELSQARDILRTIVLRTLSPMAARTPPHHSGDLSHV